MSSTALLPATAPFEPDDRVSLDRVLAGASATQRTWLSGFLAGLDLAPGGAVANAPPHPAEPLTIIYASESGNAERLAQDAGKAARKAGFKLRLLNFSDLDIAELHSHKRLIVIAATWGEGEPPYSAARAFADIMSPAAPRLEGVQFAVLALGDTAYAQFCAVGKALDNRLAELGASRATARVDCDLDFDAPAAAWIGTAIESLAPSQETADNVVAVDFTPRPPDASRDPVVAEVTELINLNSSRSEKTTVHLALAFEDGAPAYEPGDSLEVFAPNDPAMVDAVMAAAGLTVDHAFRQTLATTRDITTLSLATLDAYASLSGAAGLRRLIDDDHARGWIAGRQFVDLLEAFPAAISAEQLLGLTRALPPRAYSIASSRKEFADEIHLSVSAVRYSTHGRRRAGVASTHMADRTRTGGTLRVRVKPNRKFRLPEGSRDIIMVGPGTGVAPFRAFVQERRAVGANGRSWLFFGDRQYTHDFLYQLEWQDALKDGSLTRLDLAFSRDRPEKTYVQHRIWEARRDLVAWLEDGASFYVCGDMKAMAKDVRSALAQCFAGVKALSADAAEAAVVALERDGRYRQDVY